MNLEQGSVLQISLPANFFPRKAAEQHHHLLQVGYLLNPQPHCSTLALAFVAGPRAVDLPHDQDPARVHLGSRAPSRSSLTATIFGHPRADTQGGSTTVLSPDWSHTHHPLHPPPPSSPPPSKPPPSPSSLNFAHVKLAEHSQACPALFQAPSDLGLRRAAESANACLARMGKLPLG